MLVAGEAGSEVGGFFHGRVSFFRKIFFGAGNSLRRDLFRVTDIGCPELEPGAKEKWVVRRARKKFTTAARRK